MATSNEDLIPPLTKIAVALNLSSSDSFSETGFPLCAMQAKAKIAVISQIAALTLVLGGLVILSRRNLRKLARTKRSSGSGRQCPFRLGPPNRCRSQVAEARSISSEGQAPFAVIVGCSDSRVSPEIVFDQGIGDLFVVGPREKW